MKKSYLYVSSIRDGFSAWVKADPETILRHHGVDAKGFFPAFREAPARRHEPSSQEYRFLRRCAQQLDGTEKAQRLQLERRGKGAIERHIAGKWYIITLQEASEHLEHDFLTNRFHVTHCGGCAILFNKDTFFSDIKVSSIYLHDTRACEQDKIKEGESGWVLQGVVSRAAFRRQPCSGQKILHGHVSAHQQQLRQKAWHREEASPHYPRRDAGRARGLGHWRLQRSCLAPIKQ